jgi:hypothetical protein
MAMNNDWDLTKNVVVKDGVISKCRRSYTFKVLDKMRLRNAE